MILMLPAKCFYKLCFTRVKFVPKVISFKAIVTRAIVFVKGCLAFFVEF